MISASVSIPKPFFARQFVLFLLLTGGGSALALFFNSAGLEAGIGALAFLLLTALGFLDFRKFLLLAVCLRSALDAFQDAVLPLGPLNLNPAGFLGLSLIFFCVLHTRVRKGLYSFPAARGFLILLLLSVPAVCSAFLNFGPAGSLAVKEFIRLASLFSLLISLMAFFKTPGEMKQLFWAALLSLILPLAVGFFQAATGTGNLVSTQGQNRIFGTLFHPNTFSLYLSVFVAAVLAWHKNHPSLFKKLLLAAILAGQFLTFSLGALVSSGLIFSVHVWGSKNRKALWLFLLLLLIPIFSPNWRLRFEQMAQMNLSEEIQTAEISNSFSWRVLHWYVLFHFAKEKPLTGWGLLTTEKITPWKTEDGQGYAAHNDFVRLFLESGLVGLTGYSFFLFFTGRWIFSVRRENRPPDPGELQPALKGIFLVLVVLAAIAEEPLIHTAFIYYFFAFIALARNGFCFGHLKREPNGSIKHKGDPHVQS